MAKKVTNKKEKERNESFRMAKFWLDQIDEVDQLQKSWFSKGDAIIRRYRDERKEYEANRRRLNILWANIKILMPALYGKPPIPYVERRFLQSDPVARLSSTILERVVKNEIEVNELHPSIRRAVLDYLLVGRGAVWVRYEPDVGEVGESIPIQAQSAFEDTIVNIEGDKETDTPETEKLEATGEQLLSEQIPVDHINWKDLYLFPATARDWTEIQAVGKRLYLSKDEAKERFGEEIAKELRYTATNTNQTRKVPYTDTAIFQSSNYRNIVVYEIWNKIDRKVYWVSEGYDYLCDVKDDFLKLREFFPIPRALFSTSTNESLVPVPDYIEYQDQAIQIDELTQRLAMLTKACKIAGCYDASNGALKRLFQEGFENDLIPVDAWAAFAEKGGVQGGIALLPIEEIQKVIETLTKVRQNLMMDLDTVTGISDVVRGTTDSRETLGGIRLKNNNAGTRLSDRQREVAIFAKDVVALVAEIAAKHYSAKKLIESSNILYDQELQPEAIMEEFAPSPSEQNQQQQQIPGQPPQQGQMGAANPFQGGINSIGQPPPQNNVVPFPNLNPNAPPAMNSPMGTAPPQPGMPPGMPQLPMLQPQPINPIDIITERLEGAIKLLREDMPRGYRIDIETDSTIFGDAAQERQDAAMFVGEVSKFLAGAAQLGAQLPEAVPALCQTLLWGIRKFRVGRDLESTFDEFINRVQKKTKEALKNPKPDPESQKAQAQIEGIKLKTQADLQKSQLDHQHQTQQNQQELQKQQAEHSLDQQMAQMDFQLKQEEHQMKMKELQLKHQLEMAKLQAQMQQMQMQTEMKQQEAHMNIAQSQQEHQQNMQMNQEQHSQNIEQTQMQGEQQREQHQQTLQQTEMKGQQAEQQHKQKLQQTKLAGQQQEAKHKQTIEQAKVKKTMGKK